ncbi:matrixin family metalloprotease [Polyangium jinanense]|uniref:Matrixin family metalloprotease n=1 Tax=Polyangium jinanense TaxID=2829994 RepID=A0A9X3X8Q2_9BACT|nr:matrixin family metalloprotease [Polyangium jinanense]MDC3984850.1 matrixin family metalloprotease [Polyangium jinanense]
MRHANASNRGRLASFAIGLSLVAAVTLFAPTASAYCRTTSCKGVGTGARCMPMRTTDCGIELFWKNPCVGFSMQRDASVQIDLDDATKIFEEAFKKWTDADCGDGKHPRIKAVNLGPVECHAHEYNKKAGNANVILFHDDVWPHAGAGSTLALTTVTYNIETGEIYDADMELNGANVEFTTGTDNVLYDLPSIATHETGHFLGMSHSADGTATMFADYTPGSTELRSLENDDIEGICAAYPPGDPIPASCDPTPRRGLESQCNPEPIPTDDGGSCCATAPGTPRSAGGTALAALALALGLAARRRAERTRP